MPLHPRKFSPVQNARSETLSQPLTSLAIPRAEQWSEDFQFIFAEPEAGRQDAVLVKSSAQSLPEGTRHVLDDRIAEIVYPLLPPAPPRESFKVLQKWEGMVQEVQNDSFIAVLRDLTNPQNAEEQVTLRFEEVSDDDRALMAPGALFYWAMGYKTTLSGAKERVAAVRFRRLPALSQRDLSRARREAKRLYDLFA